MATSNPCSTCKNPNGIKYCVGCKKYFCTIDYKSHEKSLLQELDELIDQRDRIQQEFGSLPVPINHPILEEINKWEIKMKLQVARAAQTAREKVNAILSRKRSETSESLSVITEQLRTMKETEDFVETHLEDVNKKLNESKKMLEQLTQSTLLALRKKKSDDIQWDQLLEVIDNNPEMLTSKAKNAFTLLFAKKFKISCKSVAIFSCTQVIELIYLIISYFNELYLLRSNHTVRIRNVLRIFEWMQYYGLYSHVCNVLYDPFVIVFSFPPVVP